MTEELNLTWAQEQPDTAESSPDTTPAPEPSIIKSVPSQSWSMVQALRFVDMYSNGFRDPSFLSEMITESLSPSVDKSEGNSDDLSAAYAESSDRRTELGLDVIDEEVYTQQRDPRLLSSLIASTLDASGIETEVAEDTEESESDSSLYGITDQSVRDVAENGGISAQEERAREIASAVGLEIEPEESVHVVITEALEIDSTDPYIKKVVG